MVPAVEDPDVHELPVGTGPLGREALLVPGARRHRPQRSKPKPRHLGELGQHFGPRPPAPLRHPGLVEPPDVVAYVLRLSGGAFRGRPAGEHQLGSHHVGHLILDVPAGAIGRCQPLLFGQADTDSSRSKPTPIPAVRSSARPRATVDLLAPTVQLSSRHRAASVGPTPTCPRPIPDLSATGSPPVPGRREEAHGHVRTAGPPG